MFTGHVRELGTIEQLDESRCHVRAPLSAAAIEAGGSVCVSGVGLTVEQAGDEVFRATISAETRRRSTFGCLQPGDAVNVELPLRAGEPVSGHLVQGCVDGIGKVARVDPEGDCLRVWIRPPDRLISRFAAKTPVAVDGVSVTVADRLRDRFSVVVVPVTAATTTLERLAPGGRVNLELDLVSRAAASHREVPPVTAGLGRAGHVSGRAGVDLVLAHLTAGGGVAVWDPDHETEGDVIFAGSRLRPDSFRFLLTQVCGHPTVPCSASVLDRLEIGEIPGPGDRRRTAFAIPVDLASSAGTGVSAAERAAVVRRLAHPAAVPADFLRPGHVYPLRARPGLLAERAGHTEATVAPCTAAGLPPVGVCCEVMNRDGTMASAADLEVAALAWGMPLRVTAVEPSPVMIGQRPAGAAPVVRATAEHLPFADDAFDAALAVLTVHHWRNAPAGLAELHRVAARQVVLTWDPAVSAGFWLVRDYLPQIAEHERGLACLATVRRELARGGRQVTIWPVPVPADCTDGFLGAHWRDPAAYLDPGVRAAMSGIALLDQEVVAAGIGRLEADLASGRWQDRHGYLLDRSELDVGYRLVRAD